MRGIFAFLRSAARARTGRNARKRERFEPLVSPTRPRYDHFNCSRSSARSRSVCLFFRWQLGLFTRVQCARSLAQPGRRHSGSPGNERFALISTSAHNRREMYAMRSAIADLSRRRNRARVAHTRLSPSTETARALISRMKIGCPKLLPV